MQIRLTQLRDNKKDVFLQLHLIIYKEREALFSIQLTYPLTMNINGNCNYMHHSM